MAIPNLAPASTSNANILPVTGTITNVAATLPFGIYASSPSFLSGQRPTSRQGGFRCRHRQLHTARGALALRGLPLLWPPQEHGDVRAELVRVALTPVVHIPLAVPVI